MHHLRVCLLVTVICFGCKSTKTPSDSFAVLEAQAARYVSEKRPEWARETKRPARIADMGDRWRVDYVLPDNVFGGTPIIEIAKKDGSLLYLKHSQ